MKVNILESFFIFKQKFNPNVLLTLKFTSFFYDVELVIDAIVVVTNSVLSFLQGRMNAIITKKTLCGY